MLFVAFLTCLFALAAPFKTLPPANKTTRFAVLVPARNEAAVIGNLIDSLIKQNYPRELFEVFVLANGCTDDTPQISEEHGASVMLCEGTFHGKGDVLSYAFARLAEQSRASGPDAGPAAASGTQPGAAQSTGFDAYIIFDADNVVDPEFLSAMDRAYSAGMVAAQGRRTGKNTYDNVYSRIYEMYYNMLNVFYNHSQETRGCSAVINGTGWMIRKDFVDKYGFSSVSLTEDLEITAHLDLRGERVRFVPEALTYDEYPNDTRTIFRQMHRWVFGQVQCMRAYSLKLLRKLLKDRSTACAGTLGTFVLPILLTIMVILLIWTIFMPADYPAPFRLIRAYAPLIILFAYAVFALVNMFGAKKSGLSLNRLGTAIAFYPIFMCILFPFSVECLFRRNLVWKPIAHDRNVSIDDITDR